jgi:hypothetical protein
MFMVIKASTSPETFMDASSAVTAEPTRPASRMATMTGPSSRAMDSPDQRADQLFGAKIAQRDARLQGEHGADEETQDGDDREGRVSGEVALLRRALQDARRRRQREEGAIGQHNGAAEGFKKLVDACHGRVSPDDSK